MSIYWDLPANWNWVSLGDLSEVVSKGTTPTTLGASFSSDGVPFLRAEDITYGPVEPSSAKYLIDIKTHQSTLARSQLMPGDLLITIAGTLGRVGYVPFGAPSMNCNQAVAFIRLIPALVDVKYACFACQYEDISNALLGQKKVGTIGNLNLEQIRNFQIPIPPLDEQHYILSILEKIENLRAQQQEAERQTNILFQSVLHKVMRGN